ncbi:pentapeptide repeat protein [Calothrix sp. NIES-4101]|nr:pentapeptide repeat protein [Calothrix sp. NIES-4101]
MMHLYRFLVIPFSINWVMTSQISLSQTPTNINTTQNYAQQIVVAMNRAQQAYYVKNNRFTNDIKALAVNPVDTVDNSYQFRVFIHPQRNAVMQAAISKNNGYKSYIGLVRTYNFTLQNKTQTTTLATLCESSEAKPQLPIWANYQIPANDTPACPVGFRVSIGGNQTISAIEKKSPPEQALSKMLAIAEEQVRYHRKHNRFKKDWQDIPSETDTYLYRSFIHPSGKATMAAAITKGSRFKSYITLIHTLKSKGNKSNLASIQCISKENKGILPKWSDIQFSEDKPAICPTGFEVERRR